MNPYTSELLLLSLEADIMEEDDTNGFYYFVWMSNGDPTQCKIKRTQKITTPDGVIYQNQYPDGDKNFVHDSTSYKILNYNYKK
jgi:hypothetical protein